MNLQGQWNKPLFTTDQSAGKLFSISLSEHEFLLVFLFVFVSPWDIQLFQGYCLKEARATMLLFITITPDTYCISQYLSRLLFIAIENKHCQGIM